MHPELKRRLNAQFDPTNADNAMRLAHESVRLLEIGTRVLNCYHAGFRVGRDDARDLGAKMIDVAYRCHILNDRMTGGSAVDQLWRLLGLDDTPPSYDAVDPHDGDSNA